MSSVADKQIPNKREMQCCLEAIGWLTTDFKSFFKSLTRNLETDSSMEAV